MKRQQFILNSDECELLVEFESCGTVEKTAQAVAKDPSGVSRQLSRIAAKYPAIEKRQGKWVLTSVGRRLNSLTRNSIQVQRQLAEEYSVLRIGTNREFGSRIVAPQLSQLKKLFPNTTLMIKTYEYGTEEPLHSGQIDVGFDCERPNDPDIGYKLILDEPIVAVCTKSFLNKYKSEISKNALEQCPHLLCERLYPDKILFQKENKLNVLAMFNDVSATREACLTGIGWALLPRYALEKELKSKKLVIIDEKTKGLAKYGVWWLRSRNLKKEIITDLCQWMSEVEL